LLDVQGKIKERSPHYAALTQPPPLTLAEIQQQTLDPDSVLLEYMLGETRSYLWAVSKFGISSYEIAKRDEIEALAALVVRSTIGRELSSHESPAQYLVRVARSDKTLAKVSQQLSNIIFGPVANEIGRKRLLVVSEGALQYVPLPALPSPAASNQSSSTEADADSKRLAHGAAGQPMVFEHEFVSIASASTLAILRREAAARAVPSKLV